MLLSPLGDIYKLYHEIFDPHPVSHINCPISYRLDDTVTNLLPPFSYVCNFLDGYSSRHDRSREKYGEKNTRMLDPLLRTDWKDVRQSPYEILSTEQETRNLTASTPKGKNL
jgi:hypothetical protein